MSLHEILAVYVTVIDGTKRVSHSDEPALISETSWRQTCARGEWMGRVPESGEKIDECGEPVRHMVRGTGAKVSYTMGSVLQQQPATI